MTTTDPSSTDRNSTTTTKRPQPSTNLPKPPTSIHLTATIAAHAILTGTHHITISAGAVLHPYAKISSVEGPVVVGEGCVVWERAVVGTVWGGEGGGSAAEGGSMGSIGAGGEGGGRGRGESQEAGAREAETVTLGRNVVVESGAVVEAAEVGDGTIVEAYARVGKGAVLGKHCKLTPFSTLPANAQLPAFTVLHSSNQRRIDTTTQSNAMVLELKEQGHEKQLAVLRKLIPSNLAKWQ